LKTQEYPLPSGFPGYETRVREHKSKLDCVAWGSHKDGSLSLESNISISSAAQSKLTIEQLTTSTTQSDILPIGVKRMLEEIVDDPAYGEKYAEGNAKNIHTACMTLPEFMQAQGTLEVGKNQLQAAWRSIQNEGKSPAQNYAELLKYELSMPENYCDAQDPGHTMPARAFAEAKLAYLHQYMANKQ